MATPIKSGWSKLFKNMMFIHVIGICLPSHSASEKHDEEKKGPYTFAHFVNFQKMCLPYLIIVAFWVTLKRQIVPVAFPPWLPLSPPIPGHMVREPPRYMFNVSSTCSRCCFLIKKILFCWLLTEQTFSQVLAAWSAFPALFTWTRQTMSAKDHGLFYLNYPQINEVR